MSTPPTLVADRYRLVRMLGAGGMGLVWQAWDEKLHRPVALKMVRTQLELTDAERQQATDRAMREARITAALRHPHAVTVFDVIEHEGRPCIVMELVESTALSALLIEHGRFSPSQTASIGAQVGSALAAAHKLRIVHRDVKPGNILITEDGSAMISDFGISHALGDATITATGLIHGTPAYLAPEVARGMPTSFASDVYSLGSTMYTMLEGGPPFGAGKNPISLLHRVARGRYPPPQHAGPLAALLTQMLSPNPKQRPSMAEVAASLSAGEDDPAPLPVRPDVGVAPAAVIPLVLPGPPPPLPAEAPDERPDDVEALTALLDAENPEHDADAATEALPQPPPTALTLAAGATTATPTRALDATTAETVPADIPTRHEPPTAETEPLRPAPPANPPVEPGPGREPARRRGRTVLVAGALTVLTAVVLGALLVFTPWNAPVEEAGGPQADPRTTTTARASEAPTPTPTASASLPAETAPSPPSDPEPVAPVVTPEQRVTETISGYYGMLPANRDAAWPLMTADYQTNHAGGRDGYEAFWSQIAAVEVGDLVATAPDRAQATLTYHFHDGQVIQEVTGYRLVDDAGVMKIAATEVLSSYRL